MCFLRRLSVLIGTLVALLLTPSSGWSHRGRRQALDSRYSARKDLLGESNHRLKQMTSLPLLLNTFLAVALSTSVAFPPVTLAARSADDGKAALEMVISARDQLKQV